MDPRKKLMDFQKQATTFYQQETPMSNSTYLISSMSGSAESTMLQHRLKPGVKPGEAQGEGEGGS